MRLGGYYIYLVLSMAHRIHVFNIQASALPHIHQPGVTSSELDTDNRWSVLLCSYEIVFRETQVRSLEAYHYILLKEWIHYPRTRYFQNDLCLIAGIGS
ncbi:uncharacterized protein BT62DRAFT_202937 [Guyanagaster necrorhizus]|uniref:Uncharacterized protein n=1 Tax=Guyanagaster necrorhizus TaxID=856835 RepID=A0A9P8ARD8_9AGAR|nr:uncharacterized protein BT62DRAFT_202937 [Guyanagaster necrorhizus MCA 3950]KAG7444980.1 hypothetical protein BT62DRAFT_202937 [Guyanagaster necrorhizus MCA 3950]